MHREVIMIRMDVDDSDAERRGTRKAWERQRVDEEWTRRVLNTPRRTKVTTEVYALSLLTVFYYFGPGVQKLNLYS